MSFEKIIDAPRLNRFKTKILNLVYQKGDVYNKNEIDNKFSQLETNIDWKEAVATYNDIATTYPNPVDGWTVNVKDTDYTYRYNGTKWVAISANAIPKATNNLDGLLSKEDHANYEDANSKKHTHNNKSVIDGISSTNVSNWNSAKTHADSAHAPSNAQANVIETVKVNGTALTPSSKAVNIAVPTNNNQLTNGAGYITSSGTAKTISDTLPISKGGTGQTTSIDAANALIGSLAAGDTAPTDDTNIIVQGVGGNYSDKFYRKPVSLLWSYIKSKLATVATSGSYNDLNNKPTIPSVGNGTITIKQAGTTKGTFTMNQTGNTTIELTDTDTNTWRPLGTTADTACAGNDSRLSNARPASDVYSWAKASSKPSYSWSEITSKPSTFTPASHTHSYAGSSSAGGSATSAVKLDSSAGSATQPVYFSSGKPVACTYTLGKSVPSNAVFTDTNTWRDITTSLTSTSTDVSLAASAGKSLQDQINTLNSNLSELILDKLYPIGSIYLETTNTNPSSKLGGTWVAYGSSDTYLRLGGNGSGGSNTVKLDKKQIPSLTTGIESAGHVHGMNHRHDFTTNSTGSHQHKITNIAGLATGWGCVQADNSKTNSTTGGTDYWSEWSGNHSHSGWTSDSKTSDQTGTLAPNTGGVSANHTHTYTNNNQQTVSITPKYVQVYAWKRTA